MSNTNIKTTKKQNNQLALRKFKESIIAIVISILLGMALMAIVDPGLIPVFLYSIYDLSFGNLTDVSNFLANLTWMIPLGLSLGVSFRIGVFNIGSAGQMFAGGFIAFLFATSTDIGQYGWIFVLIIGMIIGMAISMIIALLKNLFNINEVITSIMFNWAIFFLIRNVVPVNNHWNEIIAGNSLRFDWIYNIFNTTESISKINIGIFIAIGLVIVFSYAYKRTNWGYKQSLLGSESNLPHFVGLNRNVEVIKTMAISGALAGLAGSIFFVGYHDSNSITAVISKATNDVPGVFFTGITIALLGFNGVWGIFFSSMLISLLTPEPISLDQKAGDMHIVDIMIASMVILMARAHYNIYYKEKRVKKKQEKRSMNKDVAKGGVE